MKGLIERIGRRLDAYGLTHTEASRRATGSTETIRNWQRAATKGVGGASMEKLQKVADVLGTNVTWLTEGTGPEEGPAIVPTIQDIPLVSWVSAGELSEQQAVFDFSDFPTVSAVDLPQGKWIALRVDGPSMNKISPPGSVIFVDLNDRNLVHNRLYIVADESGDATYKRYRQDDDPPFQPASYHDVDPPKLIGGVRVIGRVRRSMIDP